MAEAVADRRSSGKPRRPPVLSGRHDFPEISGRIASIVLQGRLPRFFWAAFFLCFVLVLVFLYSITYLISVGVGAYGVAILATPMAMKKLSIPNAPFGFATLQLDPVTAAIIALLAVGIIAAVSGKVISRLSGVAATIVSLALLIIVHSVFLNWTNLFKGNQAFFGIPKVVGLPWVLACSVVVIVLARLFKDSRWGLQLRASAQSPQAAAALGIDAPRLRLMSWVLSALICGLAGVLYAYFAGTISPKLFYFQMIFMTLAMLILGGMATVTGAVTGVIVLSIGLEFIRSIESGVTIAGVQLPQLLGLSGVALGVVIVL